MSVDTKLKLVGLWLLYSAIIVLPMFVFLLFDQPDDIFSAYGRGNANKYSIFQYNKLERERKMEHRIGKHFLREEEKNLLLEKQRFGVLSSNEEIRLELILSNVKSQDLRTRAAKSDSYYISNSFVKKMGGTKHLHGQAIVTCNSDSESSDFSDDY
jgi:hypothetical protein